MVGEINKKLLAEYCNFQVLILTLSLYHLGQSQQWKLLLVLIIFNESLYKESKKKRRFLCVDISICYFKTLLIDKKVYLYYF